MPRPGSPALLTGAGLPVVVTLMADDKDKPEGVKIVEKAGKTGKVKKAYEEKWGKKSGEKEGTGSGS